MGGVFDYDITGNFEIIFHIRLIGFQFLLGDSGAEIWKQIWLSVMSKWLPDLRVSASSFSTRIVSLIRVTKATKIEAVIATRVKRE